MLKDWLLAPLLALIGLVVFAGVAWAAGGTDVVVRSGENAHVLNNWPQGVGKIVNDRCRTSGWSPWFSEWPNDVHHYALVIKSTDDLNRLIAKLAAVKGDLRQIRLSYQIEPRSLGFVTSMPKANGIPVMFTIGDQKQIDDWYSQLGNTGGSDDLTKALVKGVVLTKPNRGTEKKFGKMTFDNVPTAIPPTLTIFVQNPLVELEQLKIPAGMDVFVGQLPVGFHVVKERKGSTSKKRTGGPEMPKTKIGDASFVTRARIERFLEQRESVKER
jgi:hypothetical protein